MSNVKDLNISKIKEYLETVKKDSSLKKTKSKLGWRLFVSNLMFDFLMLAPKLILDLISLIEEQNNEIEALRAIKTSLEQKASTATYSSSGTSLKLNYPWDDIGGTAVPNDFTINVSSPYYYTTTTGSSSLTPTDGYYSGNYFTYSV